MTVIDMVGKRCGRLTVLSRVPSKRWDQCRWLCRCDCGLTVVVVGGRLRSGSTRSCGCYRRDRCGNVFRTHGKSKTTAYTMFYDARKRAQHMGLPFDLDPDLIEVPDRCPVLGTEMRSGGPRDSAPTLDRVIPSLGYIRSNVRVISFRANRLKSDATVDELRKILAYMERK